MIVLNLPEKYQRCMYYKPYCLHWNKSQVNMKSTLKDPDYFQIDQQGSLDKWFDQMLIDKRT